MLDQAEILLESSFWGEEGHFIGMETLKPFFSLPCIHLCGTRYPEKEIPTHFFVGLEEHLQNFIPYAGAMVMVQTLLDPLNRTKHTVFPWNDDDSTITFSCLRESLAYVVERKAEMQSRFWRNLNNLYTVGNPKTMQFFNMLNSFMHDHVLEIVENFQRKETLTKEEKESLVNIERIYLLCHQDAQLLWDFGIAVIDQIKEQLKKSGREKGSWTDECVKGTIDLKALIDRVKERVEKERTLHFSNYPLTEAFYLLLQVVGAAEFTKIVSKIIK